MRSALLSLTIAALASTVAAFDYVVAVGMDEFTGQPGIGFSPSRVVIAETGDVLVFKMLGGPHQIRQVSFAAPCTPLAGGFDSGLQQIPNGTLPNQAGSLEYRQVIANRSIPLYFTDLALSNCITGATFCVNTNETQGSTTTCGAFRAAAIAQGGTLNAQYTQTAHSGFSAPATMTSTTARPTATANTTQSAAPAAFTRPSSASVLQLSLAGLGAALLGAFTLL